MDCSTWSRPGVPSTKNERGRLHLEKSHDMLENLIFAVLLMGAAVAALHYVILISSCGKWQRDLLHQWSCAIESWTKARRELRHANTSLRRAARTLEKAERRTTDGSARLAGTTDPEAEKTDETILRFKNEKESAREAVQASAKRVHNERVLLDTAGKVVHDTARQVVTSWRQTLRNVTQKRLSVFRDLIGRTWQTYKSVIEWVTKYRLATGCVLVVVVVSSNYNYYATFDFNVLPYYSEAPIDNLTVVVLAVVAVALFALLLSLAAIFLNRARAFVVFILAIICRTVAFILAQSSFPILALCRRSANARPVDVTIRQRLVVVPCQRLDIPVWHWNQAGRTVWRQHRRSRQWKVHHCQKDRNNRHNQ